MPFIHAPIFWLGLGCVSVPIIIHLLNRRRFRIRPWAAMQFLLDSVRRNRRRLRIEEMILLALRCLAILALAIAIARIFTRSDLPGSTDSHTSVFVLDDTYSMDQQVASQAIFRTATADLVEQIKALPPSSTVAIVLASAPQEARPLFDLDHVENIDVEDLARRLSSRQPSDKRVSLVDMLAKGAAMLSKEKGAKRLWVLGDFRTGDLRPEDSQALRTQIKALAAEGTELVTMDYGRGAHNNLTIESVELLDRFAIRNTEMQVRVIVRNNSPAAANRVRLTGTVRFAPDAVGADDPAAAEATPLDEQTVESIPSGRTGLFIFKIKPNRAGSAVLSVALDDDELAGDNTAQIVLNIRPALRALVVDGRPDQTDPEASESWPYRSALDPNLNGNHGVSVEVGGVEDLVAKDLEAYDFVALLDVGELPLVPARDGGADVCPSLRKLERYVRGGGGLVIYTGENVDLDFYNGPLHADGLGLSPFRIGETVRTTEYFRLNPRSIDGDGPMRVFRGEGAAFAALIRFTALTPADKTTGAPAAGDVLPARVLASFTDAKGSPAVVIRPFGQGSVVMVYTAAGNKRWHDWAKDPTYVPHVQDTLKYIARTQSGRAGQLVGAPIVHQLSSTHAGLRGSLKSPGQPRLALAPLDGFNPSAKTALGDLARRIVAVGQQPGATNKALAQTGADAAGALDANDLAALKDALTVARDALADARGQNSPAGRLQAELSALLGAGLGELYGRELRFERADRSGVYELTVQARDARTVYFARNTDPDEGHLAHITNGKRELADVFGSDQFIYKDRSAGASAADVSETTDKREYWLWAMGALLALLAVETFLGQRFGHYDTKK